MQIQLIRHATMLISYGGKKFLIDPMFASKDTFPPIKGTVHSHLRWPMCELPFSAQEIAKEPDVLIITHYSTDHLDQTAVDTIRRGKKVFVQDEEDKETLRKLGFSNLEALTPEGSSFALTRIYKTECEQGTKSKVKPYLSGFRYESMGVILQHEEEKTVYIAGNTMLCNKVQMAIDNYKPDYMIIACSNAQIKDSGPMNMTCEDLKVIHSRYPNMKIITTQLDCVPNGTLSRNDIKKYVKDNKLGDYILIPKDGEIITD